VVAAAIETPLSAVVAPLTPLAVAGPLDVPTASLTYDSRQAAPGAIFVAVRGLWVDGHEYIDRAVAAGAAAIIAETPPPAGSTGATWVQVADSTAALGLAADAFYGHPSRALAVLAVTGTNGKTTVTSLLYEVLEACGHVPGLVGTVEHRFGAVRRKTQFTTPPSADLHALLSEMRGAGCDHVALEASSHGLAQQRLAGLTVAVGGFTNLSRDHLDYHETMAAYREAKALLFRSLAPAACFNIDDPVGRAFAREYGGRRLTVSVAGDASADYATEGLTCQIDGSSARLRTPAGTVPLALRLVGRHNVENALVALGMAVLAGLEPARVIAALAQARGAPGRLEVVPGPRHVLVDYAHTPDALLNVVTALGALTPGRLICVFGAGGDRDPGKRPKMGEVAARYADVAVVTSDNPRSEDPAAIIAQILTGMAAAPPVYVDADRRAAIRWAIAHAGPQDVVLIAGKGHEDYQIIGEQRLHFDDREEAAAALAEVASASA
jgi:UDP-N-acetylmuramoyl-L-alanyl-D-glutamate--2,6-diaminopimelate ligase